MRASTPEQVANFVELYDETAILLQDIHARLAALIETDARLRSNSMRLIAESRELLFKLDKCR